MKVYFPILLLACALPSYAQQKEGSAPAHTVAIENLTIEQKRIYFGAYNDAQRLFKQKRLFECLDKLSDLDEIYDGHPSTLNLRGACYIEMRNFDKALKIFNQVLKVTPGQRSIKFNLAEIAFVTKKWQSAHDQFVELLDVEKTPGNKNLQELIEFKILLCKIKLGNLDEAKKLADKYDYLSDNPLFYYGNAAIAFQNDKLIEAEKWMRSGRAVFGAANTEPWRDTLIEFGYIKSFYGQDISDPTEGDE